jgi:hypothetical protein
MRFDVKRSGPQGDSSSAKRMQRARAGGQAGPGTVHASGLANHALAQAAGGLQLDDAVRAEMEARFGEDFADVRVHDDAAAHAQAADLGAKAFTVGEEIVFGADRFAPAQAAGKRLLAHELAHVVQQRRGGPVPLPDVNAPHERDAEQAASSFAAGAPSVAVSGATGVGVAREPEDDARKTKTVGPPEAKTAGLKKPPVKQAAGASSKATTPTKPKGAVKPGGKTAAGPRAPGRKAAGDRLKPDEKISNPDELRGKHILQQFDERAHDPSQSADLAHDRLRNRTERSEKSRHVSHTQDIHEHHGYPKFIGGQKIQEYVHLTQELHYLYHEELYLVLERELKARGVLDKDAGRGARRSYGRVFARLPKDQQEAVLAKVIEHAEDFDRRYRAPDPKRNYAGYPDQSESVAEGLRRGIRETDAATAKAATPRAKGVKSAAATAKPQTKGPGVASKKATSAAPKGAAKPASPAQDDAAAPAKPKAPVAIKTKAGAKASQAGVHDDDVAPAPKVKQPASPKVKSPSTSASKAPAAKGSVKGSKPKPAVNAKLPADEPATTPAKVPAAAVARNKATDAADAHVNARPNAPVDEVHVGATPSKTVAPNGNVVVDEHTPTLPKAPVAAPEMPPASGGKGIRIEPGASAGAWRGRLSGAAQTVGFSLLSLGVGFLSAYLKGRVDQRQAQKQIDALEPEIQKRIDAKSAEAYSKMISHPDQTVYAGIFLKSTVITTIVIEGAEPVAYDSSPLIDLGGVGITLESEKWDPSWGDPIIDSSGGGTHYTITRGLLSDIPLKQPPLEDLIAYAQANRLSTDAIRAMAQSRLDAVQKISDIRIAMDEMHRWEHVLKLLDQPAKAP